MRKFLAGAAEGFVLVLGSYLLIRVGQWLDKRLAIDLWLVGICLIQAFLLLVEKHHKGVHKRYRRYKVFSAIWLWPFYMVFLLSKCAWITIMGRWQEVLGGGEQ